MASAGNFRELQDVPRRLRDATIEFGERIEQQSATIDVLKIMSSVAERSQPVFDLIVRTAPESCDAPGRGFRIWW